jgi:hypothetical protein
LKRRLLKEGADFLWSFLQAAHGRNDLAFEVGLAGCYHATHGVGLEMFPHQLIRIAIRREAADPMARIRAYAVSGARPQEAAAQAPNPALGKSHRRDDNDAQPAPAATAAQSRLRQRIPTPCHRRRSQAGAWRTKTLLTYDKL